MSSGLTLWRNASIATCDEAMRVFKHGAILTRDGRIEWMGEESDIPPQSSLEATHDLKGAWITPTLIDCHTHLVFAGNRAAEFAQRMRGVSYEDIAKSGGGIISTVRATRAASEQQLFDESAPRLESLLTEGVGTVEIKSGYGLTLEDEAKMLRVARKLANTYPVTIKTTFLGAHATPPEYAGRPDEYIDVLAGEWLPQLHAQGLVDAVDIFCERIAFDTAQAERLFRSAQKLGLPVKMHAEQLTNIGGSQLAARTAALSCDHLEHTKPEDIAALAQAGTVAVLLPVAFYCLADTHKPLINEMRRHGVRMAVASDCNPGSSPGASMLNAMNMAVRLFGLTIQESLIGATRHAAQALGLGPRYGMLAAGVTADFAVWGIHSLDELGYWIGFNPCRAVIRSGRVVNSRASGTPAVT